MTSTTTINPTTGSSRRTSSGAVEFPTHEFDAGMVDINGYHLAVPNLPFGGVEDSGYGREHGGFGIKEFVNVKSVMITEPR